MALSTNEARIIRELIEAVNELSNRVRILEMFARNTHNAVPGFVRNKIDVVPNVGNAYGLNPRRVDSAPQWTGDTASNVSFIDVGEEYG